MPSLPTDGQTNWGDPLNAYILSVKSEADTNGTNLSSHAANSPADPHGDRAYASSLVSPITSGVNGPNGYVKTNSSGVIPANLIYAAATGGAFNNIYDAVAMYGAVAGNGLDQSTAIQNALNAAGASGGIVYLGPGTFSLANYLVMPSNVWLVMTPATILSRITASPNTPYMITNVKFGTSNTPATNIRISGGQINGFGSGVNSACRLVFMINATDVLVEDIKFYNAFNAGSAVELAGCSSSVIRNCVFDGASSASGSPTVPAVRLNNTSTDTIPSGLAAGVYTNQSCARVLLQGCSVLHPTLAVCAYGSMVDSDIFHTGASAHTYVRVLGCMTDANMTNQSIGSVTNWLNYHISGNTWSGFLNVEVRDYIDTWHVVTPQNSWGISSSTIAHYRLTPTGNVEITGSLNGGSATSATMFTLPSTYRPAHAMVFPAGANGGVQTGKSPYINIGTDGTVSVGSVTVPSGSLSVTINASFPVGL